jgi:hypothetical protein
VETRLTELLSKLAKPDSAEQLKSLEAEFQSLVEERNRLKRLPDQS